MTEEERQRILQQRGSMIGVAQGPLTLGGGGSVPAFPTNFSSFNPEQRTNPIRFGGGGTAAMSIGGASVEYAPNLTLSGGSYGPREMGARDFSPAALPQAQPQMLEQAYTNPFATPAQRFAPTLTQGLTPLPATERLPIGEGPLSMNIAAPRSAEARGLQAIQTPYGTMYATPEQASNMMTPRTLAQQSSRSPAEQQALLTQMRQRGQQIGERIGGIQESMFAQGRAQREALNTAERAARAAGASSMDILRARSAAAGPSTIAGIQQQATIGPMAPVGTSVAQFNRGLVPESGRLTRSSGGRLFRTGSMGPSGYELYEQQRANRALSTRSGRRNRSNVVFGLPSGSPVFPFGEEEEI